MNAVYFMLFQYGWIIIGTLWCCLLIADILRHKKPDAWKKYSFLLFIIKKYWVYIALGIILVLVTKPRNIDEREMQLLDNYKAFLNQRGYSTNEGAVSKSNKLVQPDPAPPAQPKAGAAIRE